MRPQSKRATQRTAQPLKIKDDYGPVGEGVSQAHGVLAENGSEYIIKGPSLAPDEFYAASNEIICAELGIQLGLPVLDTRLLEMNGELFFGSSWMEKPTYYPQITADLFSKCSNKDRVYDLVVFDTWLYNTDRHAGNLIVRLDKHKINHQMLLNDHSRCLVQRSKKPCDLMSVLDSPVQRHIQLSFIGDAITELAKLREAIDHVLLLSEIVIARIVTEIPLQLLPNGEQKPIIDYLLARRQRLKTVFTAGRQVMSNLEQGAI